MRRLARALYRTRQVACALNPRVSESDLAYAQTVLSPSLQPLFLAMHRRDQRHALEVAARLRGDGVEDADLLVAALLHDCGKGEVPVWLRMLKVVSPAFVRNAGDAASAGWRGAAYRLSYHPALGADLVQAAGGTGATVAFIRGQVEAVDEPRLALLLAADDAS